MTIADRNAAAIAPLFPPLIIAANNFIADCAKERVNILITQGLRTWQQQDALYAQGRTAPGKIVTRARGWQSYHNFGLAFDIVPINTSGTPIWNVADPAWKTAWEIGDLHEGSADTRLDPAFVAQIIIQDLDLGEGEDWTGFKDPPHFELTAGVPLAMLRSLYSKNDLSACWQEVERRL